jgi:histidinol-phosphatase (PHP family)
MRIDYHTHHERCGHAIGKLRDYVEQAISNGLHQLGLSDHMPLFHINPNEYLPEVAMPMSELSKYVEECYNLKREYKQQIDIRVGLEADYIEGREREIERILAEFEWDYVIGSVHFIGEQSDWDITDYRMVHNWQGKAVDQVYEQYYQKVSLAAQTGLFDFIGHFDVIKRFGFRPQLDPWPWQVAALQDIRKHDLAIELNTAGWQTKAAEQYPTIAVLEYCYQLGIAVTLGSDAHQPIHLARDFERALDLLQEIGFKQLATFNQRQRVLVEI